MSRYEEGIVILKEGNLEGLRRARGERPSLERSMLPSLHDVVVCSSDGANFKAHKCLLSARLDYFNSMFTGGWIEVFYSFYIKNSPFPFIVQHYCLIVFI